MKEELEISRWDVSREVRNDGEVKRLCEKVAVAKRNEVLNSKKQGGTQSKERFFKNHEMIAEAAGKVYCLHWKRGQDFFLSYGAHCS